MSDFLASAPTIDANWRAVVLFGRNVASYKFALARTNRPDDRVPLEDLAGPFAMHLCGHLRQVDRQATSRSSRFLDACRAFNRGDLAKDKLLGITIRLGFNNVIDVWRPPFRWVAEGGCSEPVWSSDTCRFQGVRSCRSRFDGSRCSPARAAAELVGRGEGFDRFREPWRGRGG